MMKSLYNGVVASAVLFCGLAARAQNSALEQPESAQDVAPVRDEATAEAPQPAAGKRASDRTASDAGSFESYKARVTANVLNIRVRPATRYEVLGKLLQGDVVQVVGEENGWCEILAPAYSDAWMAARYVASDGTVLGDRVRVRAGPGLAFTPYGRLKEGDQVELKGDPRHGWQPIQAPEGVTAWVSKDFLNRIEPVEAPETDAQVAGDASAKTDQAGQADKTDAPKETVAAEDTERETITSATEGAQETGAEDVMQPGEEKHEIVAGTDDSEDIEEAPQDVKPTERSRPPRPSARRGMVRSLGDKATDYATHILVKPAPEDRQVLCYLRSTRIDISGWELQKVRVFGTEIKYSSWKHPILEVTGIQRQRRRD